MSTVGIGLLYPGTPETQRQWQLPTVREKVACLEALMTQQYWIDNTAHRRPETSGAAISSGAVGVEEQGP